ncbi:MAG TPA: NAD(P)-binding protein [Solirubrobacteraceae bacterium]|nr:NAD(P)-binding protein [Solirubrobacteraceae bacterium]
MDKPFAISLDPATSLADRTGAWRTERPVYTRRPAPCAHACPAGEDPQTWLYRAEEGDYEGAWRAIMEVNPFPAVMGRVCYHPCETACNRAQLDEAVGINSVERFLGDEAIRKGWTIPRSTRAGGRRVLVVGAGPSGLAAAYHLALLGHEVVLHDAGAEAGGMMRYGIPAYRLPRAVLDAELERVLALGVTLRLDSRIDDLEATMRDEECSAAFVAVGAHLGKRAYIPAGSAARMLDAVALLHGVAGGEPPLLGRRVAVYGGGNTALDAARTARRLGADEAVVIYRRTRDRMPAHDSEVEEALEEGVRMQWLSTVRHVDDGSLTVERMTLDADGFPQPTGELEELEADTLVLALGQECDLGLLERTPGVRIDDGLVHVGPNLMTGRPGIFAGGDSVPAERTVTMAIGHGRTAARHIDAWLRDGFGRVPEPAEPVSFEELNPWYYSDAPRTVRPKLEQVRRQSTFDEVVGGLDTSNALFEARRCLSCGSCFACDNCYGVCPDNAVVKLAPGGAYAYAIDLDHCKGCGICAQECPSAAITMHPEVE